MDKLVSTRSRPSDVSHDEFVREQLSRLTPVNGLSSVDVVREGRGGPPRCDVVAWAPASARDDTQAGPAWTVEERVAWDDGPDRSGSGPIAGIKQVSFLRRPTGLSADEFRRRYRAHVDVARRHHPGVSRYAQNEVVDRPPELPDLDAVSELWFPTEHAFRNRLYATPESQGAVRADTETFLDLRATWSVLAVEHVA